MRSPSPLPKLDYTHGIAPAHATLVVVPMMLGSTASITAQIDALEIRYLGNQDPALRFALVSDHLDATRAETDDDAERLACARRGIERLNTTYGGDRFFLFHRRRVWSPTEQRFMGWERKRGKLTELNRLIGGADTTSFDVVVGHLGALDGVELVLTLDADSQLPMGTAARLVGTMAHPLNRPRVDERGTVVAGYGVLQPRISISPGSAQRTRFARLYADQDGIDPYTSAVSDVYQDVFSEGSYVGKGIYDLRAFEAAVQGAIPEGAVLSHDLLEGAVRAHCIGVRRRAVRRHALELSDGQPTAPPLGARRLADRPLAARHTAARRRTAPPQSAVADRALEDHRQPAPLAGGAAHVVAAGRRMGRHGAAAVVDGGRGSDRIAADFRACRRRRRAPAAARRLGAAPGSRRR